MAEYDEKVSKLDRELRFFPTKNEAPKKLTRQQVDFFNTNGYLTGFSIFDRKQSDKNRAEFDRILNLFLDKGKDSYAIDRYQDKFVAIYDAAKTPLILDYVEDLIGHDIICWATHYFCKMPGDGKGVSWHQDCSYWPLTPSKTVTVWLAIDEVDRENGSMQVIPKTHLLGHLNWNASEASEHNVLSQTIKGADRFGEPVDIELPAGSISIHSDLLVHGSLPNLSTRRRCGLTLRYCPPDVRTYWDWNKHSIICRGKDRTGHWAHVPRPAEGMEVEIGER